MNAYKLADCFLLKKTILGIEPGLPSHRIKEHQSLVTLFTGFIICENGW
jgi:hypothetical protein